MFITEWMRTPPFDAASISSAWAGPGVVGHSISANPRRARGNRVERRQGVRQHVELHGLANWQAGRQDARAARPAAADESSRERRVSERIRRILHPTRRRSAGPWAPTHDPESSVDSGFRTALRGISVAIGPLRCIGSRSQACCRCGQVRQVPGPKASRSPRSEPPPAGVPRRLPCSYRQPNQ